MSVVFFATVCYGEIRHRDFLHTSNCAKRTTVFLLYCYRILLVQLLTIIMVLVCAFSKRQTMFSTVFVLLTVTVNVYVSKK